MKLRVYHGLVFWLRECGRILLSWGNLFIYGYAKKKQLSETSCSIHKDSSLTAHPRFMCMEPKQNKGRLT